jgi:hypothetical protein
MIAIVQGVREPILAMGEFDEEAFDEALASFREWGQRPDAALWYGISWVEGRKP